MRTIKFLKTGVLGIAASLFFVSCEKVVVPKSVGTEGNMIIKTPDAAAGLKVYARNTLPAVETFTLMDIRRDANSESNLNKSVTVKLQLNPTLITDYNAANGTSFEMLDPGAYTLSEDLGNITFAPGEHAKEIKITLDKNQLDLSKQLALGISIIEVGSGAVISEELRDGLYSIGVKNKYDGKYTVTGTMVDYSTSALTGNYPWEVELRTSGASSCLVYDVENDFLLHPILNGPDWSYYGSFAMEFNFDPNTDQVITVVNPYGQPSGNGRSAQLDPSGVNQWDPSSKDITIKYWMNQPSVITPHRVSFDEVFEYTGPR